MNNDIDKTPHFLLFEEKSGKDGNPLFANQTDLVKRIMDDEKTGYHDKNPNTVKSAVSQIITGHRNLSKGLCKVVLLAVEPRIDYARYSLEDFRLALTKAVKENHGRKIAELSKEKGSADVNFYNLLTATNKAKKVIITTPEPAELHRSSTTDQLKQILLEKIGVFDSNDDDVVPADYMFYFPKSELNTLAREFWERLKAFVIEESSLSTAEVEKRLLEANQHRLKVFIVDETEKWLAPFVFFDCNDGSSIRGFCVSYPNGTPSVASLSLTVAKWWYWNVYRNDLVRPNNSAIEEYSFAKIL